MNNDHAKLILSVYRPHGQDAPDPFFAEALKHAKRDPSMSSWLREQQRFDDAVSSALASIPAPADVKAMIKTTMGASAGRRWRWWSMAAAAGLAVFLSATALVFKMKERPGGLALPEHASAAELAANLAEHHRSIGLMSQDYARVRNWIAERGGPLPDGLPPGLANLMVLGCETWQTTRGRVSLVCFVGERKQVVHLYIFENAAEHPGLPGISQPRIEREGNWSLALWENAGRAYVLGVPVDAGVPVESYLRA